MVAVGKEHRNTAMSDNAFADLRCSSAWRKTCGKGVQRERLAHNLCNRCSVLHCYAADSENQEVFAVRLQSFAKRELSKSLQVFCGVAVFPCTHFRQIEMNRR